MCDNCKCKSLLQRKDIPPTKLRRLVIKTLTGAQKSLSPLEILKIMRKSGPINKVTLYRILSILEKKEIVRKILTADKTSKYELIDPRDSGQQSLPPRFICRICKADIPINPSDLPASINKRLSSRFFGPLEITVGGICRKCKGEKK